VTIVRAIESPGPELEDVYRRLLEPNFPPEEMGTLEDLAGGVGTGSASVLVHTTGGEADAVAVGWRFAPIPVVLLSHLAVATGARGAGVGGVLLREAVTAWTRTPCLVLAEVDHPSSDRVAEAWGDPRRRLAFYTRHGARVLDLPYVQPEVHAGKGRVGGMLLLALHVDPTLLTPTGTVRSKAVEAFLRAYFVAAEGAPPLDPQARILLQRASDPAGIVLLDPRGDLGALHAGTA
jgi:GNAT superfamily N-acetyltransferase